MAKQRPPGKCKLCGEERLLCDSHYLPKGLYKTTGAGATGLKNPNPVMNINGVLKQISDQYRGLVLCESCENLFTKQSESWVLANLPKQYGDPCALQDALAPLTPTSGGQRWERYNVSQAQEFDVQKLVYFGMSIFWRSAVHAWKTSTGQKSPTVDLGAYKEPIRKFLLGARLAENFSCWPKWILGIPPCQAGFGSCLSEMDAGSCASFLLIKFIAA